MTETNTPCPSEEDTAGFQQDGWNPEAFAATLEKIGELTSLAQEIESYQRGTYSEAGTAEELLDLIADLADEVRQATDCDMENIR